jgi:hypothetical protein
MYVPAIFGFVYSSLGKVAIMAPLWAQELSRSSPPKDSGGEGGLGEGDAEGFSWWEVLLACRLRLLLGYLNRDVLTSRPRRLQISRYPPKPSTRVLVLDLFGP